MAVNLKRAYARYNRKYFDGKLPAVPVTFGRIPARAIGVTRVKHYKPVAIQIADWVKGLDCFVLMTLLHEMCHVALPYNVNHGKRFQDEMRRLACEGAFDGLW